MPRPLQRACLNDGLSLDINRLARRRTIVRGATSGPRRIQWISSYWGEIAAAQITADLSGERFGQLRVHVEGDATAQFIELSAEPRPFGGKQWYFVCPRTNVLASVIWRPPGATRFFSRRAFGRSVAYRSQFLDPDNRAHWGQTRIKNRLLRPGMDADEWDLPPKPKGMRWRTYHRYIRLFEHYDGILDGGIEALAAKLLARYGPS